MVTVNIVHTLLVEPRFLQHNKHIQDHEQCSHEWHDIETVGSLAGGQQLLALVRRSRAAYREMSRGSVHVLESRR